MVIETKRMDCGGDKGRFRRFVGRIKKLDMASRFSAGPQFLVFSVVVVGNDMVGGIENIFGRSVVLLQFDFFSFGEILFETDNILIIGTPP